MNTLFVKAPAITLRFVLLLLISTVAMVADHRYRVLEMPRGWLLTVMQPIQFVADWPAQRWHGWTEVVAARSHLLQENKALLEINQQLATEHQQFAKLQAENRRLNELLQSIATSSLPTRYRLARIVQVSLDPHTLQVQINLGSQADVFLGQPVISSAGVFGQVVHLSRYSAQVLLITDSSHALPVIDQRSGQRAIARGDGPSGLLRLPFLAAHADIREGDLLLSSGLGKVFPAGYPVATVRSVSTPVGEKFAEVVAVPVADPGKVQEVLLLWPDRAVQTIEEPAADDLVDDQADDGDHE